MSLIIDSEAEARIAGEIITPAEDAQPGGGENSYQPLLKKAIGYFFRVKRFHQPT